MLLEIDDEFVDKIVRQTLIEDYLKFKIDIQSGDLHPEDAEMFAKWAEAIETLGEWYFADFEKAVLDFLTGE